jgi:ATP-binding cassette subfamily B protein
LDFKTDREVRDALAKNAADSTMLIVAQRIGTIMDADQIMVLDEGKVVGLGTHKELLNTCAVYKQIAQSQLSEKELTA